MVSNAANSAACNSMPQFNCKDLLSNRHKARLSNTHGKLAQVWYQNAIGGTTGSPRRRILTHPTFSAGSSANRMSAPTDLDAILLLAEKVVRL